MTWLSRTVGELGKTRSLALAGAAIWSAAMVVGAFVLPVYSTESSTGTRSDTLVGVNGAAVTWVVAIPLVLTLFVAEALWRRRRASSTAGPIAWTLTGLLIGFNLLALLSIGLFILPVTVSLVIACSQRAPLAAA